MAVKTGIASTADHVVTVTVQDDPGPGPQDQSVTVLIEWNQDQLSPAGGTGDPAPSDPPPGLSHWGAMTWSNYTVQSNKSLAFEMRFDCVVPGLHTVNAFVTNHTDDGDNHNLLVGVEC